MAKKNIEVIPGDSIAIIEEFNAGKGTYIDKGNIRANQLGKTEIDKENYSIKVNNLHKNKNIIRKNDLIIGKVEVVQPSLIAIKIEYVNEILTSSGLSGLILKANQGFERGRKRTLCKSGDRVRAKVVSASNSVISLTMEPIECGVLFTSCSICGEKVIRTRDRVKCVECGFNDERKLADDFDN